MLSPTLFSEWQEGGPRHYPQDFRGGGQIYVDDIGSNTGGCWTLRVRCHQQGRRSTVPGRSSSTRYSLNS